MPSASAQELRRVLLGGGESQGRQSFLFRVERSRGWSWGGGVVWKLRLIRLAGSDDEVPGCEEELVAAEVLGLDVDCMVS